MRLLQEIVNAIVPLAPSLERTKNVGNYDCVALVLHYAQVPNTAMWKAGKPVIGNTTIKIGTPVATFVNGRYLSNKTGNHAAFFLRHQPGGFLMIDQWKNPDKKPKVSAHFIAARGGPFPDGNWPWASDNADAFLGDVSWLQLTLYLLYV